MGSVVGWDKVVGGEDDDQHVGAEEDHHQLAQDVHVEHLDVEEPHCALHEGEDVVGGAGDHDDVVDEEGDELVVSLDAPDDPLPTIYEVDEK